MTREEAIERLKTDIYKYADFTENPNENEFWMAFDLAIKALEQEPTTKNDEVIEGCECFTCKYGDWKRKGWSLDMADDKCGGCCSWNNKYESIEPTTKNDLGVDAISRSDVLKLMQDNWHTHNGDWAMQESMDDIRALPSVTPQEPRCKDCKWWKDSDGKYRRGCGAESKCRINTDKVYQGEGYCYLFEPQESEDKE